MSSYIKLSYKVAWIDSRIESPKVPPIRMDFEDVRKLRDDHDTIEASLSKLRLELVDSGTASLEALSLLEEIQIASARTQQLSHNLSDLVPLPLRCSDKSAQAAEQVFNIPELLEEIFTHLKLDEILVAMRVKKSWLNTIQGSNKLLRWLGLVSPIDGFFDCPFLGPGCDGKGHDRWFAPAEGQWYRLSTPRFMEFRKAGTWSDRRICWHPEWIPTDALEEYWETANMVEFNISCEPSLGRAPGAPEESGESVVRGTETKGMSVGDVVQYTNEILRTTGHNKKTCTNATVQYHACVKLLDNDPITVKRRKAIENFQKGWVAENNGRIPPWTGGPNSDDGSHLVFFDDLVDSVYDPIPPASGVLDESILENDDDEEEDESDIDEDDLWLRANEGEWEEAEEYFRTTRSPYDDE
ncbi:hypothetical protein CKM354_000640500 [Cercospora kikuchii]|uniref:F-box domain-containing protein n=1 Tax=Cercospora kikuchii TaxID=84275 RepID=A0A9P3CH77_9PEZI|nr:uncharacterized protein CKM354_000640500 [Cercospora kikuchii]GIZ43167.1 hypothetical protein CKM354_000640500 [Cercospora kikuchii]